MKLFLPASSLLDIVHICERSPELLCRVEDAGLKGRWCLSRHAVQSFSPYQEGGKEGRMGALKSMTLGLETDSSTYSKSHDAMEPHFFLGLEREHHTITHSLPVS